MFRRKRSYCIRNLLQIFRNECGLIWLCLTVFGIFCFTLHIIDILQHSRMNSSSMNPASKNTFLIQSSLRLQHVKTNNIDNLKITNAPLQMYGKLLQGKLNSPKSVTGTAEHRGAQNQSFSSFPIKSSCKPQTHIFFLKMHKSASSTVMNSLFRFGDTQNLTFALPYNGSYQFFYPRYFIAFFIEGFSDYNRTEFNIMCHHMRFLQSEIQKVMPSDTFYFSIIRNPVHLMESSFDYYKGIPAFRRAKTLDEFLDQPSKFYNLSDPYSPFSKNIMTFDFGFNNNVKFSVKHAHQNIEIIEAIFDLVLIAEYFDESMVLLKEALCWKLDDVVSFPLNSRDKKARMPLSKNSTEKIKNWNRLDWELYIHFNRTFWERIDQTIGREQMQQEVNKLRKRREELSKTCLEGGSMVDPKQIKDLSLAPLQFGRAHILGYNLRLGLDEVTKKLCQTLITPEIQYTKHLYIKQSLQKTSALQKYLIANRLVFKRFDTLM
uniref:Galactose-3-O-sulfotransferase 2-like n=1 Tax=Geotrypetes seraphini TaxID=260995 RepID=A0A6P8S6L7_GEOSA|nr:galactose-3-O-sulfotransferase 2-like [Geotrypetes seraphini]